MDWPFTNPSTVRILASSYLCYIPFNRPAVGKTALLRQKLQQTHYYYRISTKLAKHINICFCRFNKVSMKRKNFTARKFWPNHKFCLMINLDFFYLITWASLMVRAWNLVCGRFANFQNGRQILTLLIYGCPPHNISHKLLHNNIVSACQALLQRELFCFAHCETRGTIDLLWFPWKPQRAQWLQGPKIPLACFFVCFYLNKV